MRTLTSSTDSEGVLNGTAPQVQEWAMISIFRILDPKEKDGAC